LHQQHQSKGDVAKVENNGCSRTVPLTWNQAIQQLQQSVNTNGNANCPSADTTTHHATATLLQIKREPCQVSEVTTSNNLLATAAFNGTPAIIKIEQKSPTSISSSSMEQVASNASTQLQQNNGELPCLRLRQDLIA